MTRFAKYFNASMDSASGTNSALNVYYKKMLGQTVAEHRDALEAVGIDVLDDGSLDVRGDSKKQR